MNMLKHPIMFWHACQKKKAHGNKDDSLPMAAAARTHKIKLYSSEKGYYYGICFPSPSPIPSQNKGGNINTSQTLGEMGLKKKKTKEAWDGEFRV